MEGQNKQVLKLLLKKIASSDLFLLSEAAEKIGVSEKYLENLIRSGRLKSFKVDDQWFIEENWLNELKESLRQNLQSEINANKVDYQAQTWVRPIHKPEPLFFKKDLMFNLSHWAWRSFSLSLLMIVLVICCLPLIGLSHYRYELAGYFLGGVHSVYGAPLALIKDQKISFNFNNKINDEAITKFIRQVISPPKSNRAGQVAGEVEIVKSGSWLNKHR